MDPYLPGQLSGSRENDGESTFSVVSWYLDESYKYGRSFLLDTVDNYPNFILISPKSRSDRLSTKVF